MDTKAKIQDAFPHLTREQAAVLRDQAFPKFRPPPLESIEAPVIAPATALPREGATAGAAEAPPLAPETEAYSPPSKRGQRLTPDNLRPAIKQDTGEIIKAEPGEHHDDIVERSKKFGVVADGQRGFVDDGGNFLTREQAASEIGESAPLQSDRLYQLQQKRRTSAERITGNPHLRDVENSFEGDLIGRMKSEGDRIAVSTTAGIGKDFAQRVRDLRKRSALSGVVSKADQAGQSLDELADKYGFASTDDFLDALEQTAEGRQRLRERASQQQSDDTRAEQFLTAASTKTPASKTVNTDELVVGHKFKVGDEWLEVTAVDPDTGEVTVKDGRKFGRQTLPPNVEIQVEGAQAPAGVGEFEPEPSAAVAKLRAGEDQGDIFAKVQEPFALTGEKGTDTERLALNKAKAEQAASESAKLQAKQQGELPGTGKVLGYGGGVKAEKEAFDENRPIEAETPEQSEQTRQRMTPGLDGVKSLLLPSAKSPAHLRQAELLSSKLGPMHRRAESAAYALKGFGRQFDKLGLDREGVSPTDNKGIQFMSDVSQGRPLTGWMREAAETIEKLFSQRLMELEKTDAAVRSVRDNYFPGMWTRESRMAFNAAVETAIKRGILKEGASLDLASPEQRTAVRAIVDEYLKDGVGSEKDALQYLTRRPLAGNESFRKQKVFSDIMDAAEFGLRPISNNPIDLVKLKLAEMDRSIMAHQYFKALKARGQLKIVDPYEDVPEGWVKVNGKYGTIYGPPSVEVQEHIDKSVYDGLVSAAAKLGIKHERSVKFPPGKGSRALGLSYQGKNLVRTKFATETSVLAHEIGHQLDYRYGLWDEITGGERGNERKSTIQRDLRAIADLTGDRGGNPRSKDEKIAQMVEAYVHAPDRMKEVAPTAFQKFDSFIRSKAELKGIADIRPGIELTKLTGKKYVGLPILGYRIVPETTGDILNNYLSSSLYNNKYFGTMYKGWMAMANLLNQAQLGLGSAFHAGFTTLEAQVSENAQVVKDVFGALRGNRTAADVGRTAAKSFIASVRTPVIGDKVLDAWRNPDATVNPRIAKVVRAAELAGGGFKMETGLATDQTEKMIRNWYSGKIAQAAVRSPVALTELAMKPIMEWIVPRQKAGVFAELAWRIIDQNPDKSLEDLTPEFRQAWNRTDARLGQVRYDRLFMDNTAKNIMQALIRASGWSGGTIAELGGAFPDAARFFGQWASEKKMPADIPDRTAYLASLLLTVGTANGILTYALSGKKPEGLDYLAFWDGTRDAHGRKNRWLLPSYVKDLVDYAKHPASTAVNKAHPLFSLANDLYHNKDYYGVEIREAGAPAWKQGTQAGEYIAKSFVPFWIRGEQHTFQRGGGVAWRALPYVGVMPAPRSITDTPAESLAHGLLLDQIPQGPRTRAQAARAAQRPPDNTPYLEQAVKHLSADSAVRVFEKANGEERQRIQEIVLGKISRSRTLSPKDRINLHNRVAATTQK